MSPYGQKKVIIARYRSVFKALLHATVAFFKLLLHATVAFFKALLHATVAFFKALLHATLAPHEYKAKRNDLEQLPG